ncbi:MAG TPA: ABC transporter ATP-binding protein [Negativicutes bacterium]|nr:ABC transporter ATP-binding protein [Negativicutes bacterium]
MNDNILEVRNLKTNFYTKAGVAPAINDISFNIEKGKTLGVVGESGCGKSMTALSVMKLIPSPPGKIVGGEILFEGRDLLKLPEKDMRSIRGKDISMIFQEPMTSLNPVLTVGSQITEALEMHGRISKKEARGIALNMLELVKIPDPGKRIDEYPHQMSGGMRQRVMIAMALCCNPKLLIADEATTALDVTIQAQILHLIRDLKKRMNTAVMFITHDLGVISQLADEVMVMYAGNIVEQASTRDIFRNPLHPYTRGLISCIPGINTKNKKLQVIKGMVPSLYALPQGCPFCPRCDAAVEECKSVKPYLTDRDGHRVSCLLYR